TISQAALISEARGLSSSRCCCAQQQNQRENYQIQSQQQRQSNYAIVFYLDSLHNGLLKSPTCAAALRKSRPTSFFASRPLRVLPCFAVVIDPTVVLAAGSLTVAPSNFIFGLLDFLPVSVCGDGVVDGDLR